MTLKGKCVDDFKYQGLQIDFCKTKCSIFDLIEGACLLETHGSMSAKSLPKSVLGMIIK